VRVSVREREEGVRAIQASPTGIQVYHAPFIHFSARTVKNKEFFCKKKIPIN